MPERQVDICKIPILNLTQNSIIIIRQMMNQGRRNQRNAEQAKQFFELVNRVFFFYDAFLLLLCFILTFVYIGHQCVSLMFLYYTVFYAAQAGQHYLILKFPLIDINKHHVLYRRLVIMVGLVDASYLFACVIFWQKTTVHPIYCALHQYFQLGLWVGILIGIHFVFCLLWAVSLIQAYINRRYYLIALGGFEVEQRILEQNRAARQNLYREPDFDHSFSLPRSSLQKYFKFEDVIDQSIQDQQCCICYNADLDSHFVNAGCGHYYHEECLQAWAKLNDTCPQCRHHFDEGKKPQQKQQELENQAPRVD